MTHAYRTFTRCAGYVGLAGCFLASSAALASAPRNGIEILSAKSTGVVTGQYIEAAASARYSHVNTAQRIYTKQLVPVAKSTLRAGAVAALTVGRLYPGLSVALMAAGYIWSQSDGFQSSPSYPDEWTATDRIWEGYNDVLFDTVLGACLSYNFDFSHVRSISSSYAYCDYHDRSKITVYRHIGSPPPSDIEVYNPEPVTVPSGDVDWASVDPNIPPQLFDEMYGGDIQPDVWRDEIAAQGNDGIESSGNPSPEVTDQIGQWADNVHAQLEGQPEPNPDLDETPNLGEDAYQSDQLEDINDALGLDKPVPPFGDPDVDWQTESIDLPAYSSGIGAGSCPAGTTIPLPLGADPLQWSYQPACDLATMVRPALIGICGLIALMIVLRARGGA